MRDELAERPAARRDQRQETLHQGAGRAAAHVLAGEILLEDERQPTPAYQHLLAALDLDPTADLAARAHRGLAAIAALQKRQIGRPYAGRAG